MKADVTAVVITHNEEINLPACLSSLEGWAAEVIVVDSFSTDKTLEIAEQFGAVIVQHGFVNHPAHWNWIFQNLSVKTAWVFALDADHRITPALKREISEVLPATSPMVAGYYTPRHLIFRGHLLMWGGCTRPVLKLCRSGQVRCDEREAPDMRFYVSGETRTLRGVLLEDNLKETDLNFWVAKQRRHAYVTALSETRWSGRTRLGRPSWRGSPDERILWQKRVWHRMPRYVRPFLYFVYRYVFLGGFLDGIPGLLFHAVQGFWMRWMVDVELIRLRRAQDPT